MHFRVRRPHLLFDRLSRDLSVIKREIKEVDVQTAMIIEPPSKPIFEPTKQKSTGKHCYVANKNAEERNKLINML